MIRFVCVAAVAALLLGDQLAVRRRPVIQWEPTSGPYGGGAESLFVHRNELLVPAPPNLWRSVDRGGSWRLIEGRFAQAWGIIQSGADLFVHDQKGLHRVGTLSAPWVTCGAVPRSTRADRHLVAAGARLFYWIPQVGLFQSQDRCTTWTSVAVPWNADDGPLKVVVSRGGRSIFVMTVRGAFRTDDHGATWVAVTRPGAQTFTSVADSGSGVIIGTGNGVYRSTDGGASWMHLAFARRWVGHMIAAETGAIYAAVASASGPPYRTTVMRSQDDGSTWTSADDGLSGHQIHALVHDSVGTLYAASDTGVYRLERSGRWRHVGLPQFYVTSLTATPWGDMYASSISTGTTRTADRGASWRPMLLPGGPIGPVTVTTVGDLLMALSDGVYRSRDRGETWHRVGLHRPVSTLFSVPSTEMILAGTGDGLFRSLDNGETWIERSIGLRSFYVTSFAAGASGELFAGTIAGEGSGEVYRSTDRGDRWHLLAPEFTGGPVNALLVLPDGDVIAGTDEGIFRLTRHNPAWQEARIGPEGTSVSALALDGSERLIAGTFEAGVFVSEDRGQTWTPASAGLPTLRVRAIAVGADGSLYAATGHRYPDGTEKGGPVRIFRGRLVSAH
jgi:photosystem II stability/assembly factor-like uncharacterized protein